MENNANIATMLDYKVKIKKIIQLMILKGNNNNNNIDNIDKNFIGNVQVITLLWLKGINQDLIQRVTM